MHLTRAALAVFAATGLCAATHAAQGPIGAGGSPDPSFAGFHAWFDAADGVNGAGMPADGAAVTAWLDRTGSGHDLVRASADPAERPTFRAGVASGHPAVAFDGQDYLWGDSSGEFGTLAGAKTVFVVARVALADGGYVFDGTSSAGRNAFFTGQSSDPGRWHVYGGIDAPTVGPFVDADVVQVHSVVMQPGSNGHWLNGAPVSSGNGALAELRGLILGARYNLANRLEGEIAELLVYSAALSDADRQAVEGYLLAKHPPQPVPPSPTFTDVFVSGNGYHTYRIPSLLTTSAGTVLAFAEGRQSASDHAQNDMVMRRSTDGGATWGPLVVLHDDGTNSLNNPLALQVREGPHAGRIVFMFQRYPTGCHESCVVPGYTGPNVCRNFKMHSDDDGLTWSAPIENTMQVKRPTLARSIASGPGIGIQKRRPPHQGRLIVPFNQGSSGWQVYAAYSDDGGDSWAWGALADDTQSPGNGNEVQMAELPDGRLILNSRSSGGTQRRKVAVSDDGGETWSPLLDHPFLIEPQVMASIHVLTDPLDGYAQSRLLYAGPWSQSSRSMGNVLLSYDGGNTWPQQRLLWPGFYAYSVLTVFADQDIGVLFERSGYGAISLARFDLSWLTDGADCLGEEPTSYCTSAPNSVGSGALMTSSGSLRLEANDFTLAVGGAVPNQFGLFLYGREQGSLPLGDGFLCIGFGSGGFQRLPVVQLDSLGTAWWDLDVTAPPAAAGPGMVRAGSPTYFQFWYRDPSGPGGSGFNLSDGLAVTFCR